MSDPSTSAPRRGPWLVTPAGGIITATALTLLVLVESIFPPWAPFFILYAIAAIAIPLLLKTYRFGPFRAAMSNWRAFLLWWLVLEIMDLGIFGGVYDRILAGFGVAGDPYYSLPQAVNAVMGAAAARLGLAPFTATALFGAFVVLWAPVGEELFYRGYLLTALRVDQRPCRAITISTIFFGVRHATHLCYLWPNVPVVSAVVYVVYAMAFGVVCCAMVRRTGSLYSAMILHALVNLVGMIAT